MSDLLKEAIADAKAVRETALQNAKMALEEAFTPQLKSMLSAKLKEEELDEEETPVVNEEDDDEEEVEESSEPVSEDAVEESEEPVEESELTEEDDDDEEAEEGRMSDGHDDDEAEEGRGDMEEDDEDDEDMEESTLDLEAIIRELEAEVNEGEHEDEDDDEAEEGRGMKEEEDIEEEYEIDEAALEEDESEDLTAEEVEALYHIANNSVNELAEYKEAVHFLKDKLHEVNILNAKLLYTNKLFKEYSLDNNQKLKVVENFDRAQTTREIKLVFSTIAEQLNENVGIPKRKPIKESASAPVATTKPSKESQKVITEEEEVANRFKKLAGLIKG